MYKVSPLFSIKNQKFNVIILASGLGTRLKPETDFIPKALIELGELRAIDYLMAKYQYLADRVIITLGYSADLLRNYVKGKYPSLNLQFSHEEVSELRGPGKSLVYASDYTDSRLPTLITFCDYIIEDQFSVDYDAIGVCKPIKDYVYGTYKSLAVVEDGVAIDLVENNDLENVKDNGFTGITICHNTMLLKSIVYSAAKSKTGLEDIDYGCIIRCYLKKVRTLAFPLSKMFEFGTEDTLIKTRRYIDGNY